jgi:hypothetical protein
VGAIYGYSFQGLDFGDAFAKSEIGKVQFIYSEDRGIVLGKVPRHEESYAANLCQPPGRHGWAQSQSYHHHVSSEYGFPFGEEL